MSSAAEAIRRAHDQGRAALIGYLPAGFPTLEASVRAANILVDEGVDVIELGQPYTDPCMDGPVIQRAAAQALERGITTAQVMEAVGRVSDHGGTVMTMSYYALMFAHGVDTYARWLAEAGGAGVITADLPPEEGGEWERAADAHGLERTYLAAPSSSADRLRLISDHTRGWVYAASTMGVTGVRSGVDRAARDLVGRVRKAGAELVCVGFGIASGADAAGVASYADGVIVGSALVKTLLDVDTERGLENLRTLARQLRAGVVR